ncbi:RHS domain-containing protein [Burkholderia diffusa]|uniref:RHS domain-containing protein n=1 Tax=Burkholderia diffusa TaxID=488732 RepID=UPI0014787DFC|nr:RHS domain-containing protein [Burkholderia diffusa]
MDESDLILRRWRKKYQCDHLGPPQELTDEHSEIAWSAEYRSWASRRGRSGRHRGRH